LKTIIFAWDFYIKQKEGENEEDSGETKREHVREAEHCEEREIVM